MVAAILIWTYSLATISLWGWLVQQGMVAIFKIQTLRRLSFPLVSLLGMSAITFYGSLISLFFPLGIGAQIGVAIVSLVSFILWMIEKPIHYRLDPIKSIKPATLVLFIISSASILFLAVQKPGNYDSGLYHAQAIRWIETFPAVPGLANLHSRLGYNSSWFVLQALYSFVFLKGNSYHLMTSVMFLLGSIYFFQGINCFIGGERKPSDWFSILSFPLMLWMFSDQVSSPANDAPIALISWIIFSEWLKKWEQKDQSDELKEVGVSLICLYGVTIKLSAFPLLIISGWILVIYLLKQKYTMVILVVCIGGIMLLPWMARSLIQTGYIAYPSTAFDLFTFDWKIPKNIVKVESQTIKYWARLPHQSMDRAQSLSLKAWVTEWYLNLSTNRRMIVLGICILPFVYGLTAGFPKIRPILRRTLLPLLPAYIFVFAGILFWFYNAPDFRFGTTFLIPGLLILVIPGIQIIIEKLYILKRIIPVGVICLVIGYEMVTFATLIDIPSLQQHTLYPANYPQLPSYPDKIGETTIWIPDDAAENQCWYEPFPCIPKPNKSVELRGTQLQEGFRLK